MFEWQWSRLAPLIDGWIPRFSLFVPLIGYAIIFNYAAINWFSLEQLSTGTESSDGQATVQDNAMTTVERLRYMYFGLIALGISNAFYLWRRPPEL